MRLYGKNPVIERLKQNPRSIRKIYVQERHEDANYIRRKAKKWGILVLTVPKSKIQKMARNSNTQGLLCDIESFPYVDYDDLLDQASVKNQTIIFLDGLNDPQNLGGIIRSLACLGDFALVIPTHGSVQVTETVLRVACGGENYVPISIVKNLGRALKEAQDKGFWIAGTVVKNGESLTDVKFNFPLGLVIGSEEKGIRDVIRKRLDMAVTLPMKHQRMSLNAAHATSIFTYEIAKQRMQQ